MGCNCGRNKRQFEIVIGEGDDARVIDTSTSKVAADRLAERYPGARVRQKPAPVPAPRQPAQRAVRQAAQRPVRRQAGRVPTPRDVADARDRRAPGTPDRDG